MSYQGGFAADGLGTVPVPSTDPVVKVGPAIVVDAGHSIDVPSEAFTEAGPATLDLPWEYVTGRSITAADLVGLDPFASLLESSAGDVVFINRGETFLLWNDAPITFDGRPLSFTT